MYPIKVEQKHVSRRDTIESIHSSAEIEIFTPMDDIDELLLECVDDDDDDKDDGGGGSKGALTVFQIMFDLESVE